MIRARSRRRAMLIEVEKAQSNQQQGAFLPFFAGRSARREGRFFSRKRQHLRPGAKGLQSTGARAHWNCTWNRSKGCHRGFWREPLESLMRSISRHQGIACAVRLGNSSTVNTWGNDNAEIEGSIDRRIAADGAIRAGLGNAGRAGRGRMPPIQKDRLSLPSGARRGASAGRTSASGDG